VSTFEAPCRRPGCPSVVRWKPSPTDHHDLGALFCSDLCEGEFWTSRNRLLERIRDAGRVPDFDERYLQLRTLWWQLARYAGVRHHATDPELGRWHALYFAVGRAFARANEAESHLRVLLAVLEDAPTGHFDSMMMGRLLGHLKEVATREEHMGLSEGLTAFHHALHQANERRRWLAHGAFEPSVDGQWARFFKAPLRADDEPARDLSVADIDLLAARFLWTRTAVEYLLTEHANGYQPIVEPLPTPPPLDAVSA
jgi:hypothetical protein